VDLNNAEEYFIQYHNCIAPNGYNINEGGRNHTQSESSRKKLSDGMKGPKNHRYGKKNSPETRQKISEALRGKKRPQEVKDKISANHNPKSNLNLTFNDQYKRKAAGAA